MSSDSRREVARRMDKLTPAQRALLEQRLMARRSAEASRTRITPRANSGPCPLSYAQELLWLLSQVFDDGAYNSPGAFRLTGPLDHELFRRSLDALIERHAILRTVYPVIDGRPMQLVQPAFPIELIQIDLGALSTEDQHAESQRILKQESRFPFDLGHGPLVRPTIIRLADDDHILMLNIPHLSTDGYSRITLYNDLTLIYEALAQGREPALTPLSIQYADFAVWQRAWLETGIGNDQLQYWKRRLSGAPSRLELPTDLPRPPVRSWAGDDMSFMMDMTTREALRSTARQHGATLFIGLLAALGTLLQRYSGQNDIVIGTPFAGRNRTELDSVVGCFINPLAMRLDLSGDPTFGELIERAKETTIEAFAHADVPYEMVVRATNPERDLSQTPLFQAMMILHNPDWHTERPRFEPDGFVCTEVTHEKGWAKLDLLVGMSERATGLNTNWEYSTEIFAADTIRRMMDHFKTLTAAAAAHPDRPLSGLPMLSAHERGVLTAFNEHAEALPEHDSVKELFEAQVLRTPGAVAVVSGDSRLTFDELNRRANRVAALLRRHGVGPGTLVGVLMEKSPDLVPAVLGVIKTGGAYVPLDPIYPADRIEFMLSDAEPAVVLTHERHAGSMTPGSWTTLAIDAPGALEDTDEGNPPSRADGADLAYVIYTSGSTGQPKGAMIANRSLASAYFAYERAYGLQGLTAHAQLASFSFDVFTGDLIRSLLAGAKLVLCPVEIVADPAALYELTVREKIDAVEFVPATASLLFEYADRESRSLDHLRLVIVSSEAWRNEKYLYFRSLCGPRTRLINSYGLTEATIDSTWFEPRPGASLPAGRFVSIGRPLDNTQIYVLDANLDPQPIGVPGELCVGGVAVARGYLNRPGLTAERFVPDPFSAVPGALLYKTGDRARWLNDGTIDFLGRTDRQIKLRGFRIEPGEIEAVLERRPGVRGAVVTTREATRGEIRLVAYLETAQDNDPAVLREYLSGLVPNYMVPSNFVAIDDLPMTPNGKVDFDALPEPDWDAAGAADAFIAPRTDTECRVAKIWSEVLSVTEVGINDNFFALGGHSLMAMQVMSRLRDELGVTLPLRAVFESPTVMELAVALDGAAGTGAAAEQAPALVRVDRTALRALGTPNP